MRAIDWIMTAAAMCGTLGLAPGAAAQSPATLKERLLGSWVLVSNYVQYEDGSRGNVVGDNPGGMVTYDQAGRFSYIVMGEGRKRFAIDSRFGGTPDENKSVVVAALSLYGTYVASEDGRITWTVERASFPNWDGITFHLDVAIEGDRMTQVAPSMPSPRGRYVPHTVWQRSR